MKRKLTLLTILFSPLFFFSNSLLALTTISRDTCSVNDFCETAIPLDDVIPGEGYVCVEGCNLNATMAFNYCKFSSNPTVWYSVYSEIASRLNIHVSSSDIESPTISVFQMINNCSFLEPVRLSPSSLPCIQGSNGVAVASGTVISSNNTYLIAISSYDTTGGTFTLCVNTLYAASSCVTDSDLKIVARSEEGQLNSPLKPGETVRVCMNVNAYSAAGNGCQWFQGLVPVFGNGWDPASFDQNGQPLNATINDHLMGTSSNGVYGVATWDWFTDVDYHYNDPFRQIGDLDGNGTVDLCSIMYDPDCPNLGGMQGGCCGPCWGTPLGSILPPGWFAYGINGSCPEPGPPIRVDWGDGNSCGDGMGPWSFCFDLIVREYPDCQQDSTNIDLSIGFFTFSDGEVGSWAGAQSVCALDPPVMATLPMLCGEHTDLGLEMTEDKCADDIFEYTLDEPGIENWTWSTLPFGRIKLSPKEGENGYVIRDTLLNPSRQSVVVTYYFTGYKEGSSDFITKQVSFRIIPEIQSPLANVIYACERDTNEFTISPLPLSGGLAPFEYLWSPGGETTPSVTLSPPLQPAVYTLLIMDSIGCMLQKEIHFKVRPCQLDTITQDDDSNDMHTPYDEPIGSGNFASPNPPSIPVEDKIDYYLKVFPVPSSDYVRIEWRDDTDGEANMIIMDTRGQVLHQIDVSKREINDQVLQLDIKDYANGVYLVFLQTGKSITTTRMLKM